jgi:hypothetical protein
VTSLKRDIVSARFSLEEKKVKVRGKKKKKKRSEE